MWLSRVMFLLSSLLAFVVQALAQPPSPPSRPSTVGLAAGWDNNALITNVSNFAFTGYHPQAGFAAAVPAHFPIGDWFAINTGVNYRQKNYQWYRTGFYAGEYIDFRNSYFQIPMSLEASFGGRHWRGLIEGGGVAGYWTSGHIKGALPNFFNPYYPASPTAPSGTLLQIDSVYKFSEGYAFSSTRDNRVELGWIATFGIRLEEARWQAFIKLELQQGLTNLQKNYMINEVPRYNITETISGGVAIPFSRL
jgi:hypothetical protein